MFPNFRTSPNCDGIQITFRWQTKRQGKPLGVSLCVRQVGLGGIYFTVVHISRFIGIIIIVIIVLCVKQ
jgi:hypothetical protein